MDEARYGRVCLLLLNVCPFTLRKVIEYYYTQHGFPNFTSFLEKHKHDLFHLYKKCCCGSIQSKTTPMCKSQIELLYIQNSSPCSKGIRGDCPCQYDAIVGVKTDVMDVTLCCLMVKKLCQGINTSHIDTIRDIRNKLIHAESACLDEPTYFDVWNRVKTATLDLARNVPSNIYTDTMNKVQDIEKRLMNSDELGELRKILGDKKRIEKLEENLLGVTKRVADLEEKVGESGEKPDISTLKQRLTKINEGITSVVSFSPFQERDGDEIPIHLLYASVVVRENTKFARKGSNYSHLSKEMTSLFDIFFVDGNAIRTIYMLGDAAHGKTTYCIWLLKKWCNSQKSDAKGTVGYGIRENAMERFDFVFLLQFRNVNQNRASVVDMICEDSFCRTLCVVIRQI